MSDESTDLNIEKTGKATGRPASTPTELTPHKAGKPIALGFVLAAVYFLHAMATGSIADISLTQTLIQLTAFIGVMILASMGFKGWMGTRWSNQHGFERAIQFLADTCQGIALFVMAFGVIAFIFLRG